MYTAKHKLNGVAIKVAMAIGFLTAIGFQSMTIGIMAAAGTLIASIVSGDFRIPSQPPPRLRRKR